MSLFIPVANPLVSVDFRAKYPSSILLEKYKIEEQYQKLLDVQGNESIWRQYCRESSKAQQYTHHRSGCLKNRLSLAIHFTVVSTETFKNYRRPYFG